MPFAVTRSDSPSKMYALQTEDKDIFWTTSRDKAARLSEDEADIIVHEFSKYSDIDLDIEGIRPVGAEITEAAA